MKHLLGLLVVASFVGPAHAEGYLERKWTEQGWNYPSGADSQTWYSLSQGSQLIRMDWFKTLLGEGSAFANNALDDVYGFPYATGTADLPIGFVPDIGAQNVEWMGFNCSACHTSRLKLDGKEILVHGGQSSGDFRSFMTDLTGMVAEVSATDESVQKFYDVLPDRGGYADVGALKAELESWLDHRNEVDKILTGLDENQHWGYGRADAVAFIQAATAKVVQSGPAQVFSTANAPVNYPPAWNANQQGALQHNGLVSNGTDISLFGENMKLGAYIRNWTEALGVFAKAEMDEDGNLSTSIKGPNLLKIERSLTSLQSPQWPQDLMGALDSNLLAQGAGIYQENCVSCHGIVSDPSDLSVKYPLDTKTCSTTPRAEPDMPFVCVQPVVDQSLSLASSLLNLPASKRLIGTDPMMTCNIMLHRIKTGKLEGKLKKNTFKSFSALEAFQETEFTNQIMAALIIKDLKTQLPELSAEWLASETDMLFETIRIWVGLEGLSNAQLQSQNPHLVDEYAAMLANCAENALSLHTIAPEEFPLPGYKARPLNGIWASAPYLHNGSVPSLMDLLSAPDQRPVTFNVPNGDFDAHKVGVAQDKGGFVFNVLDADGARIVGNSNGGHVYGTSLTEDEKLALIEYLKSL